MIQPIKKINFTEDNTTDFTKVYKETFIDLTKPLPKQPICLSMGTAFGESIPIVTYGNFCCIVGASKSYKSFLKSAFNASYLNRTNQFPDIISHNALGKFVLDFDTEQSDYHVQKAGKRVVEMGGFSSFYKMFALRSLTPKERVQFIEWVCYESDMKNDIGLISIDGCADLVDNVNDLDKSNELVGKMMKITKEKNCAMITVLHRNYETLKPTGHLGSCVLKKSETTLFVDKLESIATVKAQYTRNIPLEEFSFRINNGLPEVDTIF